MPRTTAIAVLKYVTTTERDEPTSFTNSKKIKKAAAVHTTERTVTQLHVSPDTCEGQWTTAHGIQHSATNAVAPATTTTPGTWANFVARISGPKQYPRQTTIISPIHVIEPPRRSSPTRSATPTAPIPRPT